MSSITTILFFSMMIWYIIDRVKPIWADLSWGSYLTMAVAAAAGLGVTFGLGLDLAFALGATSELTIVGQVLTGLAFIAGSSGIAELIGAAQDSSLPTTINIDSDVIEVGLMEGEEEGICAEEPGYLEDQDV